MLKVVNIISGEGLSTAELEPIKASFKALWAAEGGKKRSTSF